MNMLFHGVVMLFVQVDSLKKEGASITEKKRKMENSYGRLEKARIMKR